MLLWLQNIVLHSCNNENTSFRQGVTMLSKLAMNSWVRVTLLQNRLTGAREMAQWLGVLDALTEELV